MTGIILAKFIYYIIVVRKKKSSFLVIISYKIKNIFIILLLFRKKKKKKKFREHILKLPVVPKSTRRFLIMIANDYFLLIYCKEEMYVT